MGGRTRRGRLRESAIEDRAEDVQGLDEVLGKVREESEAYGDNAPQQREPSGCRDVVGVRGVASVDMPVEIDGRCRAERVELGGLGGQGGGEERGHQQTDQPVRHVVQNECDEDVVGVVGSIGSAQGLLGFFVDFIAVLLCREDPVVGTPGGLGIASVSGLEPGVDFVALELVAAANSASISCRRAPSPCALRTSRRTR